MALFDFFKRKRQPAPAPQPAAVPAPAAPAPVVPTPEAAPIPTAAGPAAPLATEVHDFLPDPGPGVAPAHDGPERRERERRHARKGTRVLVIDDSPTIVALLRRMLQQNQLTVLEAGDAETGIEVARREVPDLIFLDIVLPGMDGFRALRTLRRDPITKDLPIIMISGNAQATEQFYVQRIGADDFMKKPFSRAEVFDRIEALLDDDGVPRHGSKPGTRAEAAAAAEAGDA